MNRYSEYKDSGIEWIGEIPRDWAILRMKNISTLAGGKSQTGDEELLSITIEDGVIKRSKYIGNDHESQSRAESLVGYKLVKKTNLVNNIMKMGFRCLGVSKYDGIVSPAYSVFEIRRDKVDHDFLHVLLRTDIYVAEYKKKSKGIQESRMRLYDDYFLDIKVILPPLPEQTQIAQYLDRKTSGIDSLIEKAKRKIELLKEQRTALINQCVTKGLDPNVEMKGSDIEWIGEIPRDWEITKIKYLSGIANGSTPKSDVEIYWNGNIRWFTPTDFKTISPDGFINASSRFITTDGLGSSGCNFIEKDSILITTRAPVGNVGKISGGFSFNQGCKSITPYNFVNIDFLYFYLLTTTEPLNTLSNGTTFNELPTDTLLNFEVPLPNKEEQTRIAQYLDRKTSRIDSLIEKEKERITLLKEYRQSLISSVVTGKVRVTEDAA